LRAEEPGRVWVAVSREKLRNRSRNLRWEYPVSRVELFLRSNCVVTYETYLWSVFLWDPGGGRWKTFGGFDD